MPYLSYKSIYNFNLSKLVLFVQKSGQLLGYHPKKKRCDMTTAPLISNKLNLFFLENVPD